MVVRKTIKFLLSGFPVPNFVGTAKEPSRKNATNSTAKNSNDNSLTHGFLYIIHE